MLSLESGHPIAKIKDSATFREINGKNKYLGVIDEDEINENHKPGYKTNPYRFFNDNEIEKEIGSKKPKIVRRTIQEKIKKGKYKDRTGIEFELNDGILDPIPDINLEREIIYISGRSGSGKSVFCANYLRNYCDVYPDNDIYLFSYFPNDPAFDDFRSDGPVKYRNRMIVVPLDNEYLEDIKSGTQLTEKDLCNSAVVFDDVDTIPNKKIRDSILDLRDQVLQTGRKDCITALCTNHVLCNGNSTQCLLNESDKIVLFPRNGSSYQFDRFLLRYCQIYKPEDRKKFISLPTRWAIINKKPRYVLYKDGAYLI